MSTAEQPTGILIRDLAARQPTPGGGAAAAIAAALGAASGAMAARYTTGPKWADRQAEAETLAETLSSAATALLAVADADASAFAAVGSARKAGDAAALAVAVAQAAAIPAELLSACARHAVALRHFLPHCNPNLASDVWVGLHLLAGAGRAAYRTLLVNRPDEAALRAAQTRCAELTAAEADG